MFQAPFLLLETRDEEYKRDSHREPEDANPISFPRQVLLASWGEERGLVYITSRLL